LRIEVGRGDEYRSQHTKEEKDLSLLQSRQISPILKELQPTLSFHRRKEEGKKRDKLPLGEGENANATSERVHGSYSRDKEESHTFIVKRGRQENWDNLRKGGYQFTGDETFLSARPKFGDSGVPPGHMPWILGFMLGEGAQIRGRGAETITGVVKEKISTEN